MLTGPGVEPSTSDLMNQSSYPIDLSLVWGAPVLHQSQITKPEMLCTALTIQHSQKSQNVVNIHQLSLVWVVLSNISGL